MNARLILTGTGTSQGIPVIGCTCVVCASDNPKDKRLRTAAIVQIDQYTICIDCGPDLRTQLLRAGIVHVDAVLLTHEHNDHIAGLDDLRPIIFKSEKPMRVYGLPRVLEAVKTRYSYAFSAEPYPGAPQFDLIPIEAGDSIRFGGYVIQALSVMHGPLEILGFRFGPHAAYLTDVKSLSVDTRRTITGTHQLVISALRIEPHWSHLTLDECLALVSELNVQQAWLTHLSHLMPRYDALQPKLPENVHIGYDGLVIEFDWQPSFFDKDARHA